MADAHYVEALAGEGDLPGGLLAVAGGALEPFADFHPSDVAFAGADDENYGEGLGHPVAGVAFVQVKRGLVSRSYRQTEEHPGE